MALISMWVLQAHLLIRSHTDFSSHNISQQVEKTNKLGKIRAKYVPPPPNYTVWYFY